MTDVIHDHLYNYPKYYDLVFGSDWKTEYDFLKACFSRYSHRPVRRVFEPACGTGRLMIKLAAAGFEVAGNDLNLQAVRYCNRRLRRRGFPATAVEGDMADFRVPKQFDAAFNLINSFRHLPSEAAAENHLHCMAKALRKGGLYLLGLHLTPQGPQQCDEESWSARRGNLAVHSYMWTIRVDRRRREETVGMTFDVSTPARKFQLTDEMVFRTYTAQQFNALLSRVGDFEFEAAYDFGYDLQSPIKVDRRTEDVVFVLRKR